MKPEFLSENFQFLVVKFSIYLNRLVFVTFCDDYEITSMIILPLPLIQEGRLSVTVSGSFINKKKS